MIRCTACNRRINAWNRQSHSACRSCFRGALIEVAPVNPDGMELTDIARCLDLSRESVKRELYSALRKLQRAGVGLREFLEE